jgi:Fe2+ transport system protein FeoA
LHTENAKLAVERMKNEISNEEAIELIKLYEQQQEVEEETTLLETDDSSNNLQKLIDLGIYKDSSERIARKAAIGKLIKENSLDDTLLVVCTMPFPHTKVRSKFGFMSSFFFLNLL